MGVDHLVSDDLRETRVECVCACACVCLRVCARARANACVWCMSVRMDTDDFVSVRECSDCVRVFQRML